MKWFIVLLPFCLGSCVVTTYVNNVVPITQKHHTIAVLPPKTTIERKLWMSDDRFNELTLKKQNELQEGIIRSLNHRNNEGKCFVEVLDIESTNNIAIPEGYNLNQISAKELCRKLKVDAVIETNIKILEPVSEATAFFLQSNSGSSMITNWVVLEASLHDSTSNAPLWTLRTEDVGTLFSIKELMQIKVIRRTTRNTPYNIKKNPYRKMYLDYLEGKREYSEEGEPIRLR